MMFEPKKSACLACRINVEQLAEEEERPQSCGRVAEGSIVMTNALIGALMVWSLQMGIAGMCTAACGSMTGQPETHGWVRGR